MLNVSLDLSEVRNFAKNLPAMKENIFEIMNLDTKRIAKDFLETMMSAEISLFLGREKYQRQPLVSVTSRNYRNGWYNRSFCIMSDFILKRHPISSKYTTGATATCCLIERFV